MTHDCRGSFIYGSLTILVGLVCFFFLADRPDHPLLRPTEQEKQVIEDRKQDNAVVRHRVIKYYQIKESLKELRYWLIVLGSFCINLQNGGMLVFSTTFVLGLGFDVGYKTIDATTTITTYTKPSFSHKLRSCFKFQVVWHLHLVLLWPFYLLVSPSK